MRATVVDGEGHRDGVQAGERFAVRFDEPGAEEVVVGQRPGPRGRLQLGWHYTRAEGGGQRGIERSPLLWLPGETRSAKDVGRCDRRRRCGPGDGKGAPVPGRRLDG